MNHSELVEKLKKPGIEIVRDLSPGGADAWHMTSCIMGESAELFDAIKKCVIYGAPVDMENVIEELGDIEFYLEGLRQIFGISREETLEANIKKLTTRYPNLVYTDKDAQQRADKSVK